MTTANILSQLGSAGVSTGFKNRIINGAMVIDQRAAGASSTAGNATYTTCDRWETFSVNASKYSIQQNAGSITPPVGYTNYLGATSTAATTLASTDYYFISQRVEGFNIADLAWGTANAKTVTLSFWVQSSLTGTFGGSINSNSYARSYPFSYTISTANTWTQISVTIPGDTTGTWLTNNGIGLIVIFGLGCGSSVSGTAGSWSGATNLYSATGAVSVVGTNGATFYITGVQLEVGTTATNFEYRDFGRELILCQRYFEKSFNTDLPVANGADASSFSSVVGYWAGLPSNTTICAHLSFKVTKRATPTITGYGNNSGYWVCSGSFNSLAFGPGQIGYTSCIFQQQVVNGIAATYGHWTASAEL